MLEIKSTSNDLIKKFASLKLAKYRQEYGLFIVDDIDIIKRAAQTNQLAYILYVNKPDLDLPKDVEEIKISTQILSKISYLTNPNNCVGICKQFTLNMPNPSKIIALDGIQDPGNGGTIARSALAFNFDQLLVSNNSFDLYNDKFIRSSKGAIFDLPIKRVKLIDELKMYKENGYKIVIADLNKNAVNVVNFKVEDKMVIVIGNEGRGISKEVKEIATQTVYIPISDSIESLNAAVAASIIMSKNIY